VSRETALCCDASRAAAEPLSGTAVHATSWLVLEVPGPWARDVSDGAALPAPARATVSAWLEHSAPSRLLFVRRPGRAGATRLAYVVRSEETVTEVRRLELDRLDELASVDLDAGGERTDARLVLVCGHGSRDRCCALRGTAVFAALEPHVPDEELWLSSHQGGHRFAGNVLVLPSGIQLGRIDVDDAPGITADALSGRIALERYRGRTCFPAPVQAAEHAIRSAHGCDRLDALRLAAANGSTVRFRDSGGLEHAASVAEIAGPAVPASCGAEPEPQRAFAVRLD
jgi:hypothetical protein